ncbi:MAG: DNA replication protein DnaD [Vulcanisaeta sp. AZ3]|jgi:sec-independent protein translocase protein TatA
MSIYLILDEQTSLLLFLFFLILIAWKPEMLPTIARELGKWYSWARKSLNDFIREINTPVYEARSEVMRALNDARSTVMSDVDPDLAKIANALGIDVKGKSRQEVLSEILRKINEGQSNPR